MSREKHTDISAEDAKKHDNCPSAAERYGTSRWFGLQTSLRSGYPNALSGTAIPLAARIVALADVYDAITSTRVYKSAFEPVVAKSMIENEAGKHFDPAIVDAFRERFEDFLEIQQQDGVRQVDILRI